jgi:hypothetical protein
MALVKYHHSKVPANFSPTSIPPQVAFQIGCCQFLRSIVASRPLIGGMLPAKWPYRKSALNMPESDFQTGLTASLLQRVDNRDIGSLVNTFGCARIATEWESSAFRSEVSEPLGCRPEAGHPYASGVKPIAIPNTWPRTKSHWSESGETL